MQGYKPEQVWVFVDAEPKAGRSFNPEELLENGFLPEIFVSHDTSIPTLDFRALQGVLVHLNGIEKDRTIRVANRIMEFGAKQVVCSGYGEVQIFGGKA